MRQEEFQRILKRHKQGLCTPDEEALVDKWFRAMESPEDSSMPWPGRTETKERSWTRVQEHILLAKTMNIAGSPARGVRNMRSRATWAVAATVVLMAASAVFLLNDLQPGDTQKDSSQAVATRNISNHTKSAMEVLLEDGSKVLLKPQSSISITEPFGARQRLVALEGEAFFTVSKDPSRPFLVNTKEVVTRVLGTSFTVSAFPDDDNITVSVVTGRVSVLTKNHPDASSDSVSETILTPNQKIIYNKNNNLISRMLVQEPVPILPADVVKRMHFEAAPIRKIFEGLEQVYGVSIEFDEAVFSACILTTSIAEGSIYDRLDMICKAIDAQYILKEDHIVITGRGCKN